jgi:HK97 family phage prohead protease
MMDRKAKAELIRGREVRRVPTSRLECRDVDGSLRVRGYASTTGVEYDMGWYQEKIARGAFTTTLAQSPDVQMLVNHEGLPLARTTNTTLSLWEDEVGLGFEAHLDADDPDATRIARKIDGGLMDQASFAFRTVRQNWDEDYEHREIVEVSLDRGDVSVVNYGANPNTSVSMRSFFADLADLDDDALVALRDDPVVTTVLHRLAVPIGVSEEPEPVPDLGPLFRARTTALRLRQVQ